MKTITLICFSILAACSSTKDWEHQSEGQAGNDTVSYEQRIANYQDSMSVALVSGQNGVLPKNEIGTTKALQFFTPSKEYRCEARFEAVVDGETFEMKTSTDRLPLYVDFGILHFTIDSQELSLHLYQSKEHPDYLFCPFKDLTNGSETYGAGRYLDFKMQDTLNPVLDFNLCYNPYCAYNYKYSCPIPPQANHLDVRIEAGVKTWK